MCSAVNIVTRHGIVHTHVVAGVAVFVGVFPADLVCVGVDAADGVSNGGVDVAVGAADVAAAVVEAVAAAVAEFDAVDALDDVPETLPVRVTGALCDAVCVTAAV